MRCSFEAIVRDPDGRTFALPRVELDVVHTFSRVEPVNAAAEALCGTAVTTLRCLSSEATADDHRHRRYELEAHGRVRGLPEIDAEVPPPANPWERPGWFAEAVAWISARVDGPVVQRSTWSISTVVRSGDAYFKAVPALFAHEPAITRFLAREHPERIPEVLDADEDRGWLLTRDFGGETLSGQPAAAWLDSVAAYADMQRKWSGRAEDLLAAGFPDRTLPQLERDLDLVLADEEAMQPGNPDGLSPEHLAALPALRDALRDAVTRMSAFGIPPSLDHGDLHSGNVAVRDGRPVLFDWTDGSVALPLVSLVPLLFWSELPSGSPTVLRDAYLGRVGAPAEAWEDAVTLGFAHQAVSYHRIASATAPHARWQWGQELPRLVKDLLERAGAG